MAVWLICGGRVGRNLTKRRVWAVLDRFAENYKGEPIKVVAGGAVYTDTWAAQWGHARGHAVQEVKVEGDKDGYKPNAPFNRNRRMFTETQPDVCLGFLGGGGTLDMMTICHNAGVPVGDVELNDDGTWEIKWWPQKA